MTTGRVSQAGAEYLYRVGNTSKVSQAGAEYLHRVTPLFSVSQAGVEFLFKAVACTTRWAQIWTITRLDGEVFRFTSLDRDLEWQGQTYSACPSLDPTASEAVAQADSAGSMDLSGALSALGEKALYAGLFDGADVRVRLVPWQGNGSIKHIAGGTFGSVEQTDTGFKVEVIGDGAALQQTPLTRPIQPDCRWLFGDDFCRVDLAPLTVSGTIDGGEGHRAFTDSARAEAAGYFRRGRVTFTSGDNAGVSAEIKDHEADGAFTLWPRLPFPIAAGDEYDMTPGCTNIRASVGGCNGCTAWGNDLRFGGYDKVKGRDVRGSSV